MVHRGVYLRVGAERFGTGRTLFRSAEAEVPEARPTGHKLMGMSVALDGDARQAAAAKVAEEHGLVRKAQAGDRLAFEELVRRYDRDVLRLALNLVQRPEEARDVYQESFLARLQKSAPISVRVQLLHVALPDRDKCRPRSFAAPDEPPRRSSAGCGGIRGQHPRFLRPPARIEAGVEPGTAAFGSGNRAANSVRDAAAFAARTNCF